MFVIVKKATGFVDDPATVRAHEQSCTRFDSLRTFCRISHHENRFP
jgi:hypothetical protein